MSGEGRKQRRCRMEFKDVEKGRQSKSSINELWRWDRAEEQKKGGKGGQKEERRDERGGINDGKKRKYE